MKKHLQPNWLILWFILISVGVIGIVFYKYLPKKTTPELKIKDEAIWKETPARELAKAVWDQELVQVEKLAKADPTLLDYKEPLFGCTLLIWAVGNEKYLAAEALLKAGANPDLVRPEQAKLRYMLQLDTLGSTMKQRKAPSMWIFCCHTVQTLTFTIRVETQTIMSLHRDLAP